MKNSGISKEPPPHRNIKLFIFWPNKPDSRLEVAHMEEAMKSFFLSAGEGVQEPAIIKLKNIIKTWKSRGPPSWLS